MQYIIIILLALLLVLSIIVLIKVNAAEKHQNFSEDDKSFRDWVKDRFNDQLDSINKSVDEQLEKSERRADAKSEAFNRQMSQLRTELSQSILNTTETLGSNLQQSVKNMGENQASQMALFEQRLKSLEGGNEQKLEAVRTALSAGMETVRFETGKSLDEIRSMVEEKLQDALEKRLQQSFETVSKQLGQVSESSKVLGTNLQQSVHNMGQHMGESQTSQMALLEQRLKSLEGGNEQKLEAMRTVLTQSMETVRTENAQKLDEIRNMVEEKLQNALEQRLQQSFETVSKQLEQVSESSKVLGTNLQQSVHNMGQHMGESQTSQMALLEQRLKSLEGGNAQKLEAMRTAIQAGLEMLRTENAKKLDEIRHTVDEQLQDSLEKRINRSFETVSKQLEQVYKGLGEMQTLASDVGGLKQVLSGVKTRGILGEIQLGNILEEILAPEQYETNIATVPGSSQRVEYAVRMPGHDGSAIWLPIDAKFPGDTYMHLQDAYASGDIKEIEAARHALTVVICSEAKDIRTKYVAPPDTTNFGIMFLPFEGLYAEVVNLGLVDRLQRDYQVNIAGPSTMAALLNSLQMGFRTLAIQKRSNEVWQVLAAVKTEFEKFHAGLSKMQQRLRQTDDELDKLIGVRTRAINRKLSQVQKLESDDKAPEILEIGTETDIEEE